MSKLCYSSDGIYKYCSDYIRSCSNDVSSALSFSVFSIPESFSYKKYLDDLNYIIGEYYSEINNIGSKIKEIDGNFDDLSLVLEDEVSKMSSIKIKDRDRMII